MVLTRQEKEKSILDLYNQGKTYKQIAELARVSPRDIKPVLERAEKEREKELGINTQEGNNRTGNSQMQKTSSFSQAYRLFSEGKTPLEVSIELNLKQPKSARYYREYWKLQQLYDLDLIYEDIGDDISYIIKLHRRMRAAGIRVEQAINLIKIANNDLPALEQKYHKLNKDVNLLESQKSKEYGILDELEDRIADLKRMLNWLETSCQEEESKMHQLINEKIRLKRLVKQFKDNDEEYLKIKKTVQNRITNILLGGKDLLRLAIYSLMESIRTDPQKYSKLIHYNTDSSSRNIDWQHMGLNYIRGQQQIYPSFDYFFEEYKSALLGDSEKLYNKLIKEMTKQIINEYSIRNSSSHLSDKGGQQQFYHKPPQ